MVSIGIPFLNPGAWLEEAVRSVFAQTLTEWELILVDDGSTDGSFERAARISDGRVKAFRDGARKGLPARLNEIATRASGDFLARMDADDLMHIERLERQLAFLLSHLEIDVVATGSYLLDVHGDPVGVRYGTCPSLREVLARGGYLHASIFARRNWFLKNPYSDAYPRAEDRELFARTAKTSAFAVLREPLYFHRWDGNVRPQALLTGYRNERRILLRFGPSLVGWNKTLSLLARSYIKGLAVRALGLVGKEQVLARRTYQPLGDEDREGALRIMAHVRAVKVPGWDG
jgi:glycosyltransferase involved in cell wall biosynthesis